MVRELEGALCETGAVDLVDEMLLYCMLPSIAVVVANVVEAFAPGGVRGRSSCRFQGITVNF
jgi:hypothetical protein